MNCVKRLNKTTVGLVAMMMLAGFGVGCAHHEKEQAPAADAAQFLSQDPQESLDRMLKGNDSLVSAQEHGRELSIELLTARAGSQKPYAALVACADSRSGPEIVFDAGYSELFVSRLAGNVVNGDVVASTEYAVKVLGTRLIVVMGHSNCGAVDAAIKDVRVSPDITNLLSTIKPAVKVAESEKTDKAKLLERSIVVNAFLQKAKLLKSSEFLRKEHEAGRIKILVSVQDLNSARVAWLDLDGLRGPAAPAGSQFKAPDAAQIKRLADAADSSSVQTTSSLSMKHDHAGHGH